jgi:hypothetical protein
MTRNFLGEYRIFTQKTSTMLLKIGKLELAKRLHLFGSGDASRGSL